MQNKYLQWMTAHTQSDYWHDSAVMEEMQNALTNGAVGMTTNPFLCNATLQNNFIRWKDMLTPEISSTQGDEKAEELIKMVTMYYAKMLLPIYEKDKKKGLVCAQVNPSFISDADKMMEQADRIAGWAPNISIKLPATNNGIKVFEKCVEKGYNATVTVSFTVPQVLAVGEAQKRGAMVARANGIEPGLAIAVMMVGRLDDYLRDVAQDQNLAVAESDIIQAGTACIKRAYQLFKEKNYEAVLMPAGCRGAYHIEELAGAQMIMSIAPGIEKALRGLLGEFSEKIDKPVNPETIHTLLKMDEFKKAYEPDGMKPEEFITYGPVNRTATQFIESGWKPLQEIKW